MGSINFSFNTKLTEKLFCMFFKPTHFSFHTEPKVISLKLLLSTSSIKMYVQKPPAAHRPIGYHKTFITNVDELF